MSQIPSPLSGGRGARTDWPVLDQSPPVVNSNGGGHVMGYRYGHRGLPPMSRGLEVTH